jgi:spore photoproduct lyase
MKQPNKLSSFSHIYIEKRALKYKLTSKIISKFKNSYIINCNHYKDIFNSYSNDFRLQKDLSAKLILAVKDENFLYKGSSLIQDQGFENFFYTPIVLNCIYDCHYCFLQGMYPSAFIVIFVNTDDFFDAVDEKLHSIANNENMFLSISYDSDLLALENITSLVKDWLSFVKDKDRLFLEVRTKSSNYDSIASCKANKNVILSYSLSPDIIAQRYEVGCATLQKRVNAIQKSINDGWNVSIVIDPIIIVDDFAKVYGEFVDYLKDNIDFESIYSFILGSFRMSANHLKSIKRSGLISDIIYYDYEVKNGTVFYKDEKDIVKYISNLIGKEEKTYQL